MSTLPAEATRLTLLSEPGRARRPLLVLGPSLGTSTRLWTEVAGLLGDRYDVVAWDLPGHGRSAAAAEAFTMPELAAALLGVVDRVLAERGEPGAAFFYAGDSVGGAVGLQLALDAPGRVRSVALVCSGARIGEPQPWRDRAAQVRRSGTPSLLAQSAERWFGPGFLDRRPAVGSALLHDLQSADPEGYAQVCEALGDWDVRDQLGRVRVPVLAVSGEADVVATPQDGREVADGVPDGRFALLRGVAHLAPVEDPAGTAALLRQHFERAATQAELHSAGMTVRRAVLGDAHVERANAGTDELTRDFQDLITRYAWGSIWTRPVLDRRARSMVTLTALLAHGHWEELAMHVRAAVRNGLSRQEIAEVLLHSAVYCGVPAANRAFSTAHEVFTALDEETPVDLGPGGH